MMSHTRRGIFSICAIVALCCPVIAWAQDKGAPIPSDQIKALEEILTGNQEESSAARKRLAVKRMIRDAGDLLQANPAAPNRFEVLALLFRAQQGLVEADNSKENREAFLETCKLLAAAPDEHAALRFDADLLLSQSEMVRKGADARERASALMPLVVKYRGTAVETKAVKVAIVMALELGDTRLVNELQQVISERYASDLEMIDFQREKLGGQVIGAPFCGVFERSDGKKMRFPMDGMGKTTVLYFWSNDELSLKHIKAIAASEKEHKADSFGRIQIISLNVDNLPDAGESILRGLGVDWPAIRLPGGRENPHYRTFASRAPALISLSPTGQAALVMAGSTKNNSHKKENPADAPDYTRLFTVETNREYANPIYANRLISLFSGEFLVLDPEGPLDPTLPPELKAVNGSQLNRDAAFVPVEKLLAIQECFVLPPVRYRTPKIDQKNYFEKAEQLCAKAIEEHPQAPDLWIVRNRRITALMGLWKTTFLTDYYERAAAEAKLVLDSNPPAGAELVARYCLVRETLRSTDANPKAVIADFLTTQGGEKASGPSLAAAAILALEVGDRALHEELRKTILAQHAEQPMMWSPVSFLLCRHSRYWIYQVPFSAGWSFGKRENYFFGVGDPEDCKRMFSAEFQTLDGKALSLPKDHAGKWTAVYISGGQQADAANPGIKNLVGQLRHFNLFIDKRISKDVQLFAAFLDDDAQRVGAYAKEETIGCPVLLVPGGIRNPLVQKLGIMAEDQNSNVLVLRPDGSIAALLTGLARNSGTAIQNIIEWQDEKFVSDALERGDIEEAKRIAFLYAPTEPPVSTDPKKKNIKPTPLSLAHLSSRARVYVALKEYEKALVDAEEVVSRQIGIDGGMSLRSKQLDDAEALRDKILALLGRTGESR